ncbi:MAG: WD40 repeat domain-containing protein, partial [Gemmataceae bacterium]
AYDALWSFVAAPEQAVPLLRMHLRPAPRTDAKIVARLIADLDSNDFTIRQKATEELSKLGGAAAPALQQALEGKPALETRRRIQQLLDQSRDWTAERLRDHRGIQALEHLGTRSARQVLQALASGAPEAQRTKEAKAALQRLAK